MLGGAINAIFAGENHALQWISNPCANGDVFSMNCLDERMVAPGIWATKPE